MKEYLGRVKHSSNENICTDLKQKCLCEKMIRIEHRMGHNRRALVKYGIEPPGTISHGVS